MYWLPFFKDWLRYEYIFFETTFDNQRYSTSELEIMDPRIFCTPKKLNRDFRELSPPPVKGTQKISRAFGAGY